MTDSPYRQHLRGRHLRNSIEGLRDTVAAIYRDTCGTDIPECMALYIEFKVRGGALIAILDTTYNVRGAPPEERVLSTLERSDVWTYLDPLCEATLALLPDHLRKVKGIRLCELTLDLTRGRVAGFTLTPTQPTPEILRCQPHVLLADSGDTKRRDYRNDAVRALDLLRQLAEKAHRPLPKGLCARITYRADDPEDFGTANDEIVIEDPSGQLDEAARQAIVDSSMEVDGHYQDFYFGTTELREWLTELAGVGDWIVQPVGAGGEIVVALDTGTLRSFEHHRMVSKQPTSIDPAALL